MDKKTMLGKLVTKIVGLTLEVLRLLYDLVEKMGDARVAEELKKFLRQEPCWIAQRLKFIKQVSIPPAPKAISVRDAWKKAEKEGRIKFVYIDPKLLADETIEEVRGEFFCNCYELAVESSFAEINPECVGGLTPGMILGLISLQLKRESGALLADGRANLFPKVRIDSVSCAVVVGWSDGGWGVGVGSVGDSDCWGAGRLVFSAIPVGT